MRHTLSVIVFLSAVILVTYSYWLFLSANPVSTIWFVLLVVFGSLLAALWFKSRSRGKGARAIQVHP
ncbi:MAG: hypothetical protein ACREBU_08550 [Nitrososphaera sp.]